MQGDHLFVKPGNGRDIDSYQGNVGDFPKSQGNVRETWLKTVYGGIFAFIWVFSNIQWIALVFTLLSL